MNEVLERIQKIETKYPALRIGQIIANAICTPTFRCSPLYHVPNDVLSEKLLELQELLDNANK